MCVRGGGTASRSGPRVRFVKFMYGNIYIFFQVLSFIH